MDILIHDYAGHPFQVELSRELASRGHSVTHVYFAGDAGPKGQMHRIDGDADEFAFLPLGGDIPYSKTNFLKRRTGDVNYGRALADHIRNSRPDVVISGNTPTESQELVVAACRACDVPFIYWCQDFYSIAASRLLEKKMPGFGHLVGAYYRFLERRQMKFARAVLHITESFCEQTDAWGIAREKVSVIPNWGPIDEISVLDRETAWARENGITSDYRFLYSGTLALKHNPAIIATLANSLDKNSEVILVSAGVGAKKLEKDVSSGVVRNLRILPLQPFDRFDEVLATGDVLLAVIEREAGLFSVPSKVLSYLCAGRPIVLAAPLNNLAAQLLIETGAGTVVEPEDIDGFCAAVRTFANDPVAAAKCAAAARGYAEAHFVRGHIANRFEKLFLKVIDARSEFSPSLPRRLSNEKKSDE